jgi:uridine kinase
MPRSPAHAPLRDLVGQLRASNGSYLTICIDGRGASGKSTLADVLAAQWPDFVVIHGDDYFEARDDPITWGDFNEERFDAEVLSRLRRGEPHLRLHPYDFALDRVVDGPVLDVDRGVIVERWFGFGLDVPWDLRIWVETPAEVCLRRGLARDGPSALGDRARVAWETVWQPREQRYIDSIKPEALADVVLDGTRDFAAQFGS